MDDNELITKKELLAITGISYGQLYRWKRENLIPESWFIKKASFTGQETFFPREKILNRIQGIKELKGRYSLDEVAEMLSPELTGRSYEAGILKSNGKFRTEIVESFEKVLGKKYFSFMELIFLNIASKLPEAQGITAENIEELISSTVSWIPQLKSTSYRLSVCNKKAVTFYLLAKEDSVVLTDGRTKEICSFDLDEISKELSLLLETL